MPGHIYEKIKKKALLMLEVELGAGAVEDNRILLSKAMDFYIFANGGRYCKNDCGRIVTSSSKSGLCVYCYNKEYHKTEAYRNKKKRQRPAYLKRRKLRFFREVATSRQCVSGNQKKHSLWSSVES